MKMLPLVSVGKDTYHGVVVAGVQKTYRGETENLLGSGPALSDALRDLADKLEALHALGLHALLGPIPDET